MRGVRGQHIESAICSSTCTARLNHRIVASDRSCGRRADGSVQSLASECALSDYPWSSLSFHDKRTSIRWHIQRIALASYGRANECQSVLHVSIGYGFSPFHHSSSASSQSSYSQVVHACGVHPRSQARYLRRAKPDRHQRSSCRALYDPTYSRLCCRISKVPDRLYG